MAVDKTEPPIKVIVTVGAISLGVLVAMRMFFVSYFNDSYEARSRAHIDAMLRGGSYVYTAGRVHADEARRLSGLPAAMTAVGRGQRPGAISPTASADLAPLQGWTLMPLEVPRPAPVAAPAPAAAPAAVAPAAVAPCPAPAAAAPAHPAVAPGAH
ncbi:MAG: hypothetical protein IPF99_18000 [Deltaproteobacteria bacterium]|nr:hypothetical protein [Deltaproteobacteria bacterium]